MVEINNQRKAFLDILAWSEGTSRTSENWNRSWRRCRRRELFTDYSDHPRKLVTLNPKLKSTGAGRYQLLSRWWDATNAFNGLKDFSQKSQDAVALQQIKERGALPMIDRGDIVRQSTVTDNIDFTAGRWLWSVRHKADSLITGVKKRAERSEIDVWAESPRLSPALVITIIVCLSWAVNHYRDNAITYKTQRDKNARELKLAVTAINWHADASAWCCCARCKIHEELADAKAKMMLCVMMLPLVVVGLHIKAVCQSVREATASGVDNAASPDWQTPLNGIISPSEGWSLCKNNWKEPEVY